MRRAAALATAIVLGLLLLFPEREGNARSASLRGAAPDEPSDVPAREAPEPESRAAPATRSRSVTVADGVVIDAEGTPVAGFRLLAIPRDNAELWDAEDPFTWPGEDPSVPFTHTDAMGGFAFEGLPRGDYRLSIDEGWTLDPQVTFQEDTRGLRVVATRASMVEVLALDLATSEPIPRFVVRYRWPYDGPERAAEGIDGVFRARLRGEGLPMCRLEAAGYHGVWAEAALVRTSPPSRAWLPRAIEGNLALRVRFEDGAPCEEDASVHVSHRGEPRHATIPAVRGGDGLYRVPIPPGDWHLDFRPDLSIAFYRECRADIEIAAGERREIALDLDRGGEVVVRRRGWSGRRWWLTVTGGGDAMVRGICSMPVDAAEHVMRHVEAGRYLFRSMPDEAESAAGREGWSRTIEVTTGSRHEWTIE